MRKQDEMFEGVMTSVLKKHSIELLNTMFFSNEFWWDGIDQFHLLPILESEDADTEEESRMQQRCCYLVNNENVSALKCIITVSGSSITKVCYRILNSGKIPSDYNTHSNKLDFVLSDTKLGLEDGMSDYYYLNASGFDNKESALKLLKTLLSSSIVVPDEDISYFELEASEVMSYPPYPGDRHFVPIRPMVLGSDA